MSEANPFHIPVTLATDVNFTDLGFGIRLTFGERISTAETVWHTGIFMSYFTFNNYRVLLEQMAKRMAEPAKAADAVQEAG